MLAFVRLHERRNIGNLKLSRNSLQGSHGIGAALVIDFDDREELTQKPKHTLQAIYSHIHHC